MNIDVIADSPSRCIPTCRTAAETTIESPRRFRNTIIIASPNIGGLLSPLYAPSSASVGHMLASPTEPRSVTNHGRNHISASMASSLSVLPIDHTPRPISRLIDTQFLTTSTTPRLAPQTRHPPTPHKVDDQMQIHGMRKLRLCWISL